MEKYLLDFQKFNNKMGDLVIKGSDSIYKTIVDFLDFTWTLSEKKIIMTDLKGTIVKRNNDRDLIMLTDPTIHEITDELRNRDNILSIL